MPQCQQHTSPDDANFCHVLQLSGLGFFFLSLLGAVSAVLAFLAALYGTSAVSLFALSSVLNAQNRIQHGAGRNGQHPYLRQHME